MTDVSIRRSVSRPWHAPPPADSPNMYQFEATFGVKYKFGAEPEPSK